MAACDVGLADINTTQPTADLKVDSVALEGLMSRGRKASLLLAQKNGDKEGVANDLASVSLEERRADVDKALVWLKQEMIAMRRQDQELVKQLMGIRSMIQKLKRRQQEDWVDASDSSESEDDGRVEAACVSKLPEKRRVRLSSGGLNGLSTISRIRRSRSCTTTCTSATSIDEDTFEDRVEDKIPVTQENGRP